MDFALMHMGTIMYGIMYNLWSVLLLIQYLYNMVFSISLIIDYLIVENKHTSFSSELNEQFKYCNHNARSTVTDSIFILLDVNEMIIARGISPADVSLNI